MHEFILQDFLSVNFGWAVGEYTFYSAPGTSDLTMNRPGNRYLGQRRHLERTHQPRCESPCRIPLETQALIPFTDYCGDGDLEEVPLAQSSWCVLLLHMGYVVTMVLT